MNINEIDAMFRAFYLGRGWTPMSDYVETQTDGAWGDDIAIQDAKKQIAWHQEALEKLHPFRINEESEEYWNMLQAYRAIGKRYSHKYNQAAMP